MMKSKLSRILICVLFFAMAPAWAISLSDAKDKGWVGERLDGYLGVVVKNAESEQVVADINAKRKRVYQQLAQKNQVALEIVAQLAGEKAIAKTKSGHYIQDKSGNWVKKL